MSSPARPRRSTLGHWSRRYFLTLLVGLAGIGVLATLTFNAMNLSMQRHAMTVLSKGIAQHVARHFVSSGALEPIPRTDRFNYLHAHIKDNRLFVWLFVTDTQGRFMFSQPVLVPPPLGTRFGQEAGRAVNQTMDTFTDPFGRGAFFMIAQNVVSRGQLVGHVYLLDSQNSLDANASDLWLLVAMLASAAVLGWVIIYLLTRTLVSPVRELAVAAEQVVAGRYDIPLEPTVQEREFHDLQSSFANMVSRLSHLEAMRTLLLAGVTHELKTPVIAMDAIVRALKDGVVAPDQTARFLELYERESQMLKRMVDDLLDFNAGVTGTLTIRPRPTELGAFVAQVVDEWQGAGGQGEIAVRKRLRPEPLWVHADPTRIHQVLVNLLNNARDALSDGRGTITVTACAEGGQARVAITDTGGGIPEDERALVFESFHRGRDKRKSVHGLGLGLPLSRMIMRAHGGDLVLEETGHRGTTFTVTLPRTLPTAA